MTDAGGHWVEVSLPGGRIRSDWVPDAQPGPPGDAAGSWHVVRDAPDALPRWEWHPAKAAPGSGRWGPLAGVPRTRWLLAGGVAAALAVAIVVGAVLSGGSDGAAQVADGDGRLAGAATPGADADRTPRDVSAVTTDAAAPTPSPGTAPKRATAPAGTPAPTPLTWQQQVAQHPDAPVRLAPLASDWAVEQIIIGHDLAGRFLGRVNVRYSGPGAATGRFEVTLLKDGKVVATLTGSIPGEVRPGVYPVILSSIADYLDGPWTTQFRVVSTS